MKNAIGEVFLLAGLACFIAREHARLLGVAKGDATLSILAIVWIAFGGVMVIARGN